MASEFEVLSRVVSRLGVAPPPEVWAGDDAAVLGDLVITVDPVVEGVHIDRSLATLADAGWKVAARNVSDVAAMGAVPWRAFVSVIGASEAELDEIYDGLLAAAGEWGFAVAGGDLSSGPLVVVTVTMVGRLDGRAAVLRSSSRAGDHIWLASPDGAGLGRGVAGLRLLRAGDRFGDCQSWFARPRPSVANGLAAREAGATAMVDVSDGLAADLGNLAVASGVGVSLAGIPVAEGATEMEALAGGDEYALAFTAAPGAAVESVFDAAGLAPPVLIGTCTADAGERTVDGRPFPPVVGWQHPL